MNLRQDLGTGSFLGSHPRKCRQGRGPMSQEKEGHWDSASREAVWDIPQGLPHGGGSWGIYPPVLTPHW